MSRFLLRLANGIFTLALALGFVIAGAYACYALWDNNQIYAAVENAQADLLKIKPVVEEAEEGISFEEILKINDQVRAWITLDNTKIDHPVVQGTDNFTYVNTDVYGEFSLSGSIFLDCRCDGSFGDPYSLLYVHHMENSGMFGDLDLYKEADFFRENTTGTLLLPEGTYELEIFACLLVTASDDCVFEPESWKADLQGCLSYVRENSMHLHSQLLEEIAQMENPRILGCTTCSSEFTDARTAALALIRPAGEN